LPPVKAPVRRSSRRGPGRLAGALPARLLAAAVLLASGGAGLAYSENPGKVLDVVGRAGGFEVRMVRLDGHEHTSGSAIVAALRLGPRVSLLTLDVDDVRERIEALPWVAEATVRKGFPRALDIAIVEATPAARWRSEGVEVLVAADGSVLADRVPFRYRDLPLVAGRGANEAVGDVMGLYASHPEVTGAVAAAIRVNERRWDLLLSGGATVRLPEEAAGDALDRFARLQGESRLLDAGAVVVDVRLPGRTTVELSPAEGGAIPVAPATGGPRPVFDDPLARTIAEAGL
jgi:cell division protein FtsQ